ncbi:hypothetical protein [Caldicellulosiruptor morganii]|uniref:Uncharacterized protein n=1 Tax=Caldicellulosiruptor morganii TaxID=1387555 RepID=A0ABY7BRA2_9FIRM|nr:hypothetical protein [Caldicellulosiruptor morganii]WAM34101.1 hypothetical protein OTK00_000262 [Caldicellulosiruptor morganii]
MYNTFIFITGFVGGIAVIILYLKWTATKSSQRTYIKLGPVARSFDELKEMFISSKEDVESELQNYIEFSTVERGKKLAERVFAHITVCLGILASLERFGVNPNKVLEELKNQKGS